MTRRVIITNCRAEQSSSVTQMCECHLTKKARRGGFGSRCQPNFLQKFKKLLYTFLFIISKKDFFDKINGFMTSGLFLSQKKNLFSNQNETKR